MGESMIMRPTKFVLVGSEFRQALHTYSSPYLEEVMPKYPSIVPYPD